ncbi:class I SAM-dependent methyltransferase [Methanonatronarchaeum sp. AMET-Sl]|uniref:class I SAM-dependent methyltransferase n=1 Tax=Methanonatronarchaeum sp. AMET-Sl TaxID=3037654 RepID=UPI00244E402A|nr:class I SAM-dependent methyltransferase [Methanonatronarchaeum sp. AMET-Sl]WGI17639.1 class I SAM-dependent methyltransferase [Methanonatronarchaeum sp. AMET-Sl]
MKAHKYRFEKILDRLPESSKELNLLDIGTTPFTLFLKEKYPDYEISTLDRTDLMENRCKEKDIEFKSCNLDKVSIPFEDNQFDIVIFTEVLEHIFAPPSKVLNEINRILKNNGKLIISVPNIASLHRRVKLLLGRNPLPHPDNQFKKDWVHGHGHLHLYTRKELISILKDSDFKIKSKKFLQPNILSNPKNEGSTTRIVKTIYYTITKLFPPFRNIIFVECIKNA